MRLIKNIRLFVILALTLIVKDVSSQELRGSLEVPVINKEKYSAELGLDTRFEYDNGLSHKDNLLSLKLGAQILDNFQFKTAYRHALNFEEIMQSELGEDSYFNDKSRLTFDLIYKTKRVDNYRIKNKFRYQVSDMADDKQKTYLRYKLLLDYKFSKQFRPFYGGELIYKPEDNKLRSFRIYLGNEQEIMDRNVEGYFIIENEFKKTSPINLNYILGFNIKL